MTSTPTLTVQLRPATASDQPAIRQLIWRLRLNPSGLKWQRFIVAEIDGQFAGCIQCKPHADGSLELASMAVAPEYRRQGIGSQLARYLIAQTASDLYLICPVYRVTYYRRFGFEEIERPAMPRAFRRITRIMQLAKHLGAPGLAVMYRPRTSEEQTA